MSTQRVRSVKRCLMITIVAVFSLWITSNVLAALPSDTTIADFEAGTVSNCYAGPSTWDGNVDGEVILSPTLEATFMGTSVPAGWYTGSYNGANFPVVGNSFVTVEASYAGVTAMYGPARTLEFEATFNGPNQWVGFTADSNLFFGPWALFGTFGSGVDLYADTPSAVRTQVITGGLGIPHRFQINWSPGIVTYYIDGALVASHNVNIALPMRPIMADNAGDNLRLSADWLRMGPYAPTNCTYTSRLFDSGIATPTWITLTTSTFVPTNTALSFETRSGNTPNTNDASWSTWQVVSGSSIASPTQRYLQYRALLATTDPLASPRVYSVQPQGVTPTSVKVYDFEGRPASAVPNMLGVLLSIGLGVFSLVVLGYRATKARKAGD